MKKGNKLICKKEILNFIINGCYTINFKWGSIVFIYSDKNKDKGSYFTIVDDDYFEYYLWDYFYTEVELRKLKLDSINEEG